MIFADASAILAVLLNEPDAPDFLGRLQAGIGGVHVSPLVRFEVVSALARDFARQGRRLMEARDLERAGLAYDAFLTELQAREIALDAEIGRLAIQAAQTYGKLVRHPAQLNMGDCFAYACAKSLGAALLYKGSDFAHTDLA